MAAECAFDQLLISKVQQLQHLQHSPLALATIAHRMPWENCEKNKVIFENVALKTALLRNKHNQISMPVAD